MAVLDVVRDWAARVRLWTSPLGGELGAFSRWVEESASPGGEDPLRIVVDDGDIRVAGGRDHHALGRWRRLWRFLDGLGIVEIALGQRLESNQVADVLNLLFAERRSLRTRGRGRTTARARRLRSPEGLKVACTVVRLDGGCLSVDYSYCMTRFSALVRWFKARQTHLRDHRALFRAAPRYAAVIGLLPLVVFLLYAVHGSWALLLGTSVLGSLLLAASTYVFFMTVGSVEYDNEEQAHTLKSAYGQLRVFADRIQSDMNRARSIQLKLLPRLTDMPLPEHLAWAASFEPQDEVGGDYFDVGVTRQGTVAVIFADVSGHGLGAALITVILKSTFESWLERDDEISCLVVELNRRLVELTPDGSFAAVTVGVYNPQHREFSYCVCGHSPHPYLVPAAGGRPQPLDGAQTLILGVMPDVDPRNATVALAPGDTLVFATDGITEARDASDEEYGVVRLERFLFENAGAPPPSLVAGLVRDVERYSAGCDQSDDRAILAFAVL